MLIRKLVCPVASIQYANRIFYQRARTAERVAAALDVAASTERGRIYLSRSRLGPATRRKGDERALETRLERYGYVVVHPETLTLDKQIALFSGERTIVGTRGSAFHTALFAPPGSRSTVGMIGWGSLDGHYVLIDGVKQHRSVYLNGATITRDPVTRALDLAIDVERTLDLMRDEGLL